MATTNPDESKKSKMMPVTEGQFQTVWTQFALQPEYKNPEHKRIFQATLTAMKKKGLISSAQEVCGALEKNHK